LFRSFGYLSQLNCLFYADLNEIGEKIMHLSSCTKYVIISITYLTPKPGWASLGSLRASARIREDGGGHCPKTLPPTPFPYDASNQATYNPYINIPV